MNTSTTNSGNSPTINMNSFKFINRQIIIVENSLLLIAVYFRQELLSAKLNNNSSAFFLLRSEHIVPPPCDVQHYEENVIAGHVTEQVLHYHPGSL